MFDEKTQLKLLEALLDMVNQHCTDHRHNPPLVRGSALSANENAIDLLMELGYLERSGLNKEWYRWTGKEMEIAQ